METQQRIEAALASAIARAQAQGCPPQLAGALRDAVFPGGARIRPKLCLAVARACGDDQPALADAAAAAVELLHCASLVHDDMPCFDDAPLRRGKPSIHRAYGERVAVLAGDALIVLGFETLAHASSCGNARLAGVLATLAAGVGAPNGIVAGQAWECESQLDLGDYHRAKTGALFAAAAAAGAQAAGASAQGWYNFGLRLGEAYQVADDIRDAAADPVLMGKPAGRDAALGRPNMAAAHGLSGALLRFESLMAHVLEAVPSCHGSAALRHMVRMESERLVPKAWHGELARQAA
jgi:geranylgeranyl diphosphate synthase type II